jgi:hypothetical protein
MNTTTVALINIGIALFICGLNVPLILRKIPMNRFYGVRFAQSFRSEHAWYEINESGGKYFLIWSLPILFVAIYGLLCPISLMSIALLSSGVLTCSVAMACLQSYSKAKAVDKKQDEAVEV